MIELNNVTIVAVDTKNYGGAIASLKKCAKQVMAAKLLLLTDIDIKVDGIEIIKINKLLNKNDYSYFIMKELYKYIDTDITLIVQHDSWILDGNLWDNDFYNYDYIGARWMYPESERCIGNGGFSARSKKLLTAVATDDFIKCTQQEDDAICRLYGEYLELNHDIKFAPLSVCDKFSFELVAPTQHTFGFHNFYNEPYKDAVVIKRTAAGGDLLMAEPVMRYYHEKGYRIYLDTLPEFMSLFFQHDFPVQHISQMNPKIKPLKIINLDGSYESKPKELVLKTYYEFSEITDFQLRKPKLIVNADEDGKWFNRYIIIHIDNTNMEYRNQHGIDWEFVVKYFERLGFTVLQIGKRVDKLVATYFNTLTIEVMMYLIKGCDLFIGIDSLPSHIAVALNIKSLIMSGSVDLSLRHPDLTNIEILQELCPKQELRHCYHNVENSEVGNKCVINESMPPCCTYSTFDIISKANKLLNN